MIKYIMLFLALAAASCAPAVDRGLYLNSLVGQPEAEIVRRMGVPSRTYDTGGRRFIAYLEKRTSIYGSGPSFGFGGFGGFGYGGYGGIGYNFTGNQVVERICETTFEVAEGRVVTWALRGNACA